MVGGVGVTERVHFHFALLPVVWKEGVEASWFFFYRDV